METVREQLVKKREQPGDKIKQYLIFAVSVALAAIILFTAITFGAVFSFAGILLAALILWGGYYICGLFNVEYEYCIAGTEMTVDKIIDQKRRKTLCTVDLKACDGFYKEKKVLSNTSIISAEGDADVYTIEYSDPASGRTLLYFCPDERTLSMISPYLPRLT